MFWTDAKTTREESFRSILPGIARAASAIGKRDMGDILNVVDEDRVMALMLSTWIALHPTDETFPLIDEFFQLADGICDGGTTNSDLPRLCGLLKRLLPTNTEYHLTLAILGYYDLDSWYQANPEPRSELANIELAAYTEKLTVYNYIADSDPEHAYRKLLENISSGNVQIPGWSAGFDESSHGFIMDTANNVLADWDSVELAVSNCGQEFRPIVGSNYHGPDGTTPHQRSLASH